jgi:hypothetical protein
MSISRPKFPPPPREKTSSLSPLGIKRKPLGRTEKSREKSGTAARKIRTAGNRVLFTQTPLDNPPAKGLYLKHV